MSNWPLDSIVLPASNTHKGCCDGRNGWLAKAEQISAFDKFAMNHKGSA